MKTKSNEIFEWRGVEGFVAAEITSDDNDVDGGYVTGDVFDIAGVSEIQKSTESSSATKYYNNIAALVISSTGADEIKIITSGLPLDIAAKVTGQMYDTTTGTLIEGERETKYFAIGYKTKKTNGEEVYVWRLKGTFSIPDSTHKTEDDGTDAEGQELTYTGIQTTHKFTKNGKGAKAVNVDVGKGLCNVADFFTTVQTPDTLKPKTPAAPSNGE